MVPWAKQVLLVSPRPVAADVLALSTVRVRYLQPYEDHSWGGGTFALDAAIERIDKTNGRLSHRRERDDAPGRDGDRRRHRDRGDGFLHSSARSQGPRLLDGQTGHSCPRRRITGRARPSRASTSPATRPRQPPGLRKHGVGSASGTVSGFRYNARLLARHIAEKHFGHAAGRPALGRDEVVPFLASRAHPCARALDAEVISRPSGWARPGRRPDRRGDPAARRLPRRGRGERARSHRRDGRPGADLPGSLPPHRRRACTRMSARLIPYTTSRPRATAPSSRVSSSEALG